MTQLTIHDSPPRHRLDSTDASGTNISRRARRTHTYIPIDTHSHHKHFTTYHLTERFTRDAGRGRPSIARRSIDRSMTRWRRRTDGRTRDDDGSRLRHRTTRARDARSLDRPTDASARRSRALSRDGRTTTRGRRWTERPPRVGWLVDDRDRARGTVTRARDAGKTRRVEERIGSVRACPASWTTAAAVRVDAASSVGGRRSAARWRCARTGRRRRGRRGNGEKTASKRTRWCDETSVARWCGRRG